MMWDIYDVNTSTWSHTRLPTVILYVGDTGPVGETGSAQNLTSVSIGNKIIFAGGSVGNPSSSKRIVNMYDVAAGQWLPSARFIQGKSHLSSFVFRNKAYFVGGYNGSFNVPSDTIEIYDDATGSWNTMKIPYFFKSAEGKVRAYIKAVQAGCKMFLVPTPDVSGTLPADPARMSRDSIAVYDFARDTWNYFGLPNNHMAVTAVAVKNKVYFAGGKDATTEAHTNIIDILTLEPKLQLAVESIPSTQHDFGQVLAGEEEEITIQLSNEGDYDLLFAAMPHRIAVSGDTEDFTIDKSALEAVDTLSPAQVINLPVTFAPISTGAKQLTISIYSNDPENPVYTYTLKGKGDDAITSVKNAISTTFKIYPNPATDLVQIESTDNETIHLQVVNSQGMVVKDKALFSNTSIDISSLATGLYFFKFSNEKFSEVFKVVKK